GFSPARRVHARCACKAWAAERRIITADHPPSRNRSGRSGTAAGAGKLRPRVRFFDPASARWRYHPAPDNLPSGHAFQHREADMSSFDEYANKYKTARMELRNGVLQVTLHTDGQALRWGFLPHSELPEAFHDIGADRENRVVILTGTGDEFSGPRASPGTSSFPTRPSIQRIDRIHQEGRHLLMNLLNIEVPVIGAVNGPAWRHSEIPLLCDIVLAAETAQ